jgi:hypothetical protein
VRAAPRRGVPRMNGRWPPPLLVFSSRARPPRPGPHPGKMPGPSSARAAAAPCAVPPSAPTTRAWSPLAAT